MGVSVGSSIYNAPSIYESGLGGGGAPYLKNIIPTTGVKVIDENGFIGGDFLGAYYTNYYNNFAVVVPGEDYSNSGLGTVTFVDTTNTIGGKVYNTVTINGVTWLAENLDYKFSGCGIGGSGTPGLPNAWYYNDDETTYGIDGLRKCGLLYNWYAVKLLIDNRLNLIPGWHVPTKDEYLALINAVGGTEVAGTKLKSADVSWAISWGGTDEYGFGVLPAGRRATGYFNYLENDAYLWTATDISPNDAYYINITLGPEVGVYSFDKANAYSVRLVKDQ